MEKDGLTLSTVPAEQRATTPLPPPQLALYVQASMPTVLSSKCSNRICQPSDFLLPNNRTAFPGQPTLGLAKPLLRFPSILSRSRTVSLNEFLHEITLRTDDTEEIHLLSTELRAKRIDLRKFCSAVRRIAGKELLFDTVCGLQQNKLQPETAQQVFRFDHLLREHRPLVNTIHSGEGRSVLNPEIGGASSATAVITPQMSGVRHARNTVFLHALFCGKPDCPIEACCFSKERLCRAKRHATHCSLRDRNNCPDCKRWEAIVQLKEKFFRKLIGIVKAPSTCHGVLALSHTSPPGYFRHRLKCMNASVAQRILRQNLSSEIR